MDGQMGGWTDGWMDRWVDGKMDDGGMDGWVDGWMMDDGLMGGWMSRQMDGFQHTMADGNPLRRLQPKGPLMGLCSYQLPRPQVSKDSNIIDTITLTLNSQALQYPYSHPGWNSPTTVMKKLRPHK